MSDLNRRQFVITTAAAAAAAACCACELVHAAESPAGEKPSGGGGGGFRGPLPKGKFDCGPKTDIASDGVVDKFAKKERILIVRDGGKIYAPTATCTHKNCAVKLKQDEIVCPCHGSKFSIQGTSIKGPAKGSLFRYAIKLDDNGHIIVDRDKQFAEKDWGNPEASIPV
jgi:Rieske Fe-S protein